MATRTINFTHKRTVVLSVLLLAVIASGFPRIEVHAHPDAHFGHVHDVQDYDEPDRDKPENPDEQGDNGVLHVHEIGATTLMLVSAFDVDVVTYWRVEGGIPPPAAKPRVSVIPPLHRPPIV